MKWFLKRVIAPVGVLAIMYQFLSTDPLVFVLFILFSIALSIVWGWKIVVTIRGASIEEYSKRASKGWHKRLAQKEKGLKGIGVKVKIECMCCGKDMGTKLGYGVEGVTTSIRLPLRLTTRLIRIRN